MDIQKIVTDAAEKVTDAAIDKTVEKVKEKIEGSASPENTEAEDTPQKESGVDKEALASAASSIISGATKVAGGAAKVVGGAAKVAAGGAVKAAGSGFFMQLPTIIGSVVAVIALGSFFVINPFGWDYNLLFDTSVKIEKTVTVVDQVRKISEFTTACYYEEYVIKKDKTVEEKSFFFSKVDTVSHEIVLTVKGTVRAGFNFSAMSENDIVVKGDTIDIKLPAPEVFDVISNPSDYKIFVETGKWEHDEIVAMQSQGRKYTLDNALKNGILQRANKMGKERVITLFGTFGFTVVNVTLTELAVATEQPGEVIEEPASLAEETVVASDSITATAVEEVAAAIVYVCASGQ